MLATGTYKVITLAVSDNLNSEFVTPSPGDNFF